MSDRGACNQVALSGQIIEAGVLRHTPAGIPVIEWRIAHESFQEEAGQPRRVECEMNCMAAGSLARMVSTLPIGTRLLMGGFLAARSLKRRSPVLHVTTIEFMHDTTKD